MNTDDSYPLDRSLYGLRQRVVAAAGRLGWACDDVARFALALTGTRWAECGEEELRQMLEEYDALIGVVEAKQARERRSRWAS